MLIIWVSPNTYRGLSPADYRADPRKSAKITPPPASNFAGKTGLLPAFRRSICTGPKILPISRSGYAAAQTWKTRLPRREKIAKALTQVSTHQRRDEEGGADVAGPHARWSTILGGWSHRVWRLIWGGRFASHRSSAIRDWAFRSTEALAHAPRAGTCPDRRNTVRGCQAVAGNGNGNAYAGLSLLAPGRQIPADDNVYARQPC